LPCQRSCILLNPTKMPAALNIVNIEEGQIQQSSAPTRTRQVLRPIAIASVAVVASLLLIAVAVSGGGSTRTSLPEKSEHRGRKEKTQGECEASPWSCACFLERDPGFCNLCPGGCGPCNEFCGVSDGACVDDPHSCACFVERDPNYCSTCPDCGSCGEYCGQAPTSPPSPAPEPPSPAPPASCSANPGCVAVGLSLGDCCPAPDGMMLACCEDEAPTQAPPSPTPTPPAPEPPSPAPPASCSANPGCVAVGLSLGDCCPAPDGMMLACCGEEAPTQAPPSPTPEPTNESQCMLFDEELVDTDLSGDLLATSPAASSDECCGMCEETEGCDGFSFASVDMVCYLKGNFLGTYFQAGVATQLKASLGAGCPGFEAAEQDKDLVGDLIEDWASRSPEACCESCGKKDFCEGIVFFDNRCYL